MLLDGGPTRAVDDGCYANLLFLCGRGVRPGSMFFLCAFRIERLKLLLQRLLIVSRHSAITASVGAPIDES